ncbi:hypothetical protein TCAL_16355, partial [Tigriopus californicus]
MILKPNSNIVRFCLGLMKIDQFYLRKEIHAVEGVHGTGMSKFQADHLANHPLDLINYSVKPSNLGFVVSKTPGNKTDLQSYSLKRNRFRCNSSLCMVVCGKCPDSQTCAHIYTCNCPKFSYSNLCKHIHLISMTQSQSTPTNETSDQFEVPGFNGFKAEERESAPLLKKNKRSQFFQDREFDDEELKFHQNAKEIEEKAKKVREIMASNQ